MILGDNGQDNYRDKQWLYQGGTHVPFVVAGPEKYIGTPGQVRDDLAIHIDMAPASLAMAGIPLPEYLEGVDLFSPDYNEREYIVTARDRCDWTVDRIRTILTKDYKYVRNYYPEKPYMQSNYRDEWKMVVRAKEMYANGELNACAGQIFPAHPPRRRVLHPATRPLRN
jgi:N-sulfoglucosamine sulfohydrolase